MKSLTYFLFVSLIFSVVLFANEKITPKMGHDVLDNSITELADKLFIFNKLRDSNEEIAITSFVDLHQLNKTTHFGRTLSEAFFDELFTRGFNVTDFRGQETLSINANGEYFITRNIDLLDKDVTSAYVLVGTYSYFEGKIVINARIIDNKSGKVLASARSNYITDDCNILENCVEARKIRIVSDNYKKHTSKENITSIDNKKFNTEQKYIRKKTQVNSNIENNEEILEVKTKTEFPLINLIK